MMTNQEFHINQVYFFNGECVCGYQNNPVENPNGITLLVDISTSMKFRKDELKVAISALSAMGNIVGQIKLPNLTGGTSLADAAETVSSNMSSDQKFLIITDGDDTTSKNWTYDVPYPDPSYYVDDREAYDEAERKYMDDKQSALIDHLQLTTNAEIFLIGIGNEVKDLIKKAAEMGRRIIPVHIEDKATVNDITKVVKTALKAPPRKRTASNAPQPSSSGSNTSSDNDNDSIPTETSNAIVINLQMPECQNYVLDQKEAQEVQTASNLLVSEGELDKEELKQKIEKVETAVAIESTDKKFTRSAVLWFLRQLFDNRCIAGSVIGGKRTHLFEDPGKPELNTNFHCFLNKFLYQAKVDNMITSQTCKNTVKYKFENKCLSYKNVAIYSLSETHRLSKSVLDEMIANGEPGWSHPVSMLVSKIAISPPHTPNSASSAGSSESKGKKRTHERISIPHESDSDSD